MNLFSHKKSYSKIRRQRSTPYPFTRDHDFDIKTKLRLCLFAMSKQFLHIFLNLSWHKTINCYCFETINFCALVHLDQLLRLFATNTSLFSILILIRSLPVIALLCLFFKNDDRCNEIKSYQQMSWWLLTFNGLAMSHICHRMPSVCTTLGYHFPLWYVL